MKEGNAKFTFRGFRVKHQMSACHNKCEYRGLNETAIQGFEPLQLFFGKIIAIWLRVFMDTPIEWFIQMAKVLDEPVQYITRIQER